jgi:hypothetical protein
MTTKAVAQPNGLFIGGGPSLEGRYAAKPEGTGDIVVGKEGGLVGIQEYLSAKCTLLAR